MIHTDIVGVLTRNAIEITSKKLPYISPQHLWKPITVRPPLSFPQAPAVISTSADVSHPRPNKPYTSLKLPTFLGTGGLAKELLPEEVQLAKGSL